MPYKYNPFTGNLDIVAFTSGAVVGPASSTDDALVRFDGTTGKLVQNSVGILSDAGALSGLTQLDVDNIRVDGNTISSTDVNGNVTITPNGTGNVTLTPLTGILSSNGASGVSGRTLTQPAAGIIITNADGTAGNPTLALANDLAAVEGLATAGLATRTAADTWTTREITGANGISVANGDGVAGNPTVSVNGASSFTAGSVMFWNGSALDQDNANLFYNNTDNRMGIGMNTPLDTLHVVGAIELDHTSLESDDHGIIIVCDANGFTDVKALDINYITGGLAAGEDEESILVNIDESASIGGIMIGYLVLTTSEGSATVNGYETGININPVVQQSGTFGNADSILNIAVDVTAALATGGAGAISIFVADDDTITIGDAAKFDEFEIILATSASGAGIAPTFEYSTGGAAFSLFSPADGTNGFRNTGTILWDSSTLAGWATATSGLFEIRITRTRNTLATTPIIDKLQISSTTEFKWDKNGDVNINSLTLVTDLAVSHGGTGASTLTDGGIVLGSGTGPVTVTAQPTNGQLLIGSTGMDPVLASIASSDSSITMTAGAGTIDLVVAGGTSVGKTLTGDSGGALSPTAGNWNILGGTGATVAGATSTLTVNVTGGGFTWTDVTGTSSGMVASNGYVANNAGLVTLTLPATCAVGDTMRVVGKGAGGWKVAQNASQTIHFASSDTTAGVGGSLDSTGQYDCIEILCVATNTDFVIISSIGVIGVT